MNDDKRLTMKEKDFIFENIWENYSKTKKSSNIYAYLAIAAVIFLSLIIFSISNTYKVNPSNNEISSIINTDIYEDDEIIFDSSINDMSDKELDNIIAQL